MKLTKDTAIEVTRAVAAALSGFPGAKTVTLLLGYLKNSDPEVVANAAASIGELRIKEGINPVINLRDNKDVRVRRSASKALSQLGSTMKERDPLLRLFAEYLQDADLDVRINALNGLRLVKDRRAIAAMAPLVQDKELSIRMTTLSVLGNSGHKSAVETISPALEDDSKMIRKAAAQALGKLKMKSALPLLKAQLAKEKEADVKDAIQQAIKAIG